ncbi:DNA adenine methylase [Sulfuricurvum sp.]|uniref:DNA adenine methylase n=1 Tax=Sulfuricurvum sp. TaxID=2025608 RepID=UPI0026181055|nr:DNA adenine methylase [Sulfuricurvum sp.]MDD2267000.1 DNA adenine methylase [Sulfuricurvum sp.]MDD2782616.1 DNA adenine methylase [Sulfuricurvum sp.]
MHHPIKAPFAWIGGKSKLADDIVAMFPEHRLYVEVFGGALNVLYRKQCSTKQAEVVNDINGELINLHRIIRTRPQSLSSYLNRLLISREVFSDILSGRMNPTNNIERAALYFYLLSQSFGAKGTTFAMNAKSRRPKDIYKDFGQWSKRLKFVTIENMSFDKLIRTYDADDAFFYCDPPYVSTESYYQHTGGFGEAEHRQLSELLHGINGKFLLSYNDCELVRELYADMKIISTKEINYTLRGAGSKKAVREVFITNY